MVIAHAGKTRNCCRLHFTSLLRLMLIVRLLTGGPVATKSVWFAENMRSALESSLATDLSICKVSPKMYVHDVLHCLTAATSIRVWFIVVNIAAFILKSFYILEPIAPFTRPSLMSMLVVIMYG
jgi:hypothetical protein